MKLGDAMVLEGYRKDSVRAWTEVDRLRAALTLISSFKGKTLIAPSFGPDYNKGHQAGSNAAFESAADIASTALSNGERK